MEPKISIWQVLFYFSMAVLTLWLILKLVGIIKTPLWLELGIPMASLILGIFAFCHNIMKYINNLSISLATLTTKVGYIERDISSLNSKVNHLDKDIGFLKNDVSFLKKKIIS